MLLSKWATALRLLCEGSWAALGSGRLTAVWVCILINNRTLLFSVSYYYRLSVQNIQSGRIIDRLSYLATSKFRIILTRFYSPTPPPPQPLGNTPIWRRSKDNSSPPVNELDDRVERWGCQLMIGHSGYRRGTKEREWQDIYMGPSMRVSFTYSKVLNQRLSYLLGVRSTFYETSVVVEALRYKPEGRGFDSRWGNRIVFNLPNPSSRTRPSRLLSL
jgi:hypothetical protein